MSSLDVYPAGAWMIAVHITAIIPYILRRLNPGGAEMHAGSGLCAT